MPKLFYLVLLCWPLNMNAQSPWANVPTIVETAYFDEQGNAANLYLKLDTLQVQVINSNETDLNIKSVIQTWYSGETKIGYGYATRQGLPFGVWQYFVKKNNGYEKVFEGSYMPISSSNLVLDERYATTFGSAKVENIKAQWLQPRAPGWLFTGEWRFYENGHLRKMVVYNDKAVIRLQESIEGDNPEQVSLYITAGMDKLRLSGKFLSAILFLKDGSVEAIRGPINLDFKDAKPVVPPLQ
jgi:hypothetical protein